jgi:hypothetical membrane protein
MALPVNLRSIAPIAAFQRYGGWLTRPVTVLARLTFAVPAWVLITAGLSPVLTAGGWLIAGAVQPPAYSPLRQTVSVMAGYGGTDRWLMTSVLLAVGTCYLATALGLTAIRMPARLLLVVAGLSSIGIAASPEPYTGSTPQHLAWTVLGAITIAVWPAVVAWPGAVTRGPRPWVLGLRVTVVVSVVFIALLIWTLIETQGGTQLGLAERLTSAIETAWPFVVAVTLWRGARSATRAG